MPTFDAADLSAAEAYAWLTGLVVPRPIAWVGARSTDGVANLAPSPFGDVVRIRIDDRAVAEPGADAAVDMPALDPDQPTRRQPVHAAGRDRRDRPTDDRVLIRSPPAKATTWPPRTPHSPDTWPTCR